ncbi:hypothetical protein HII31_01833 [Pseudocercospora fuligena]|uniref:Uncharacterized protein n=1 Tax=Pseudocercospora fuligena TaxID=685502 RepID=A0A8H6VM68_9PEZI|nr:hypothetical protein HII31_01833 [Pseudocercospora fuligena]
MAQLSGTIIDELRSVIIPAAELCDRNITTCDPEPPSAPGAKHSRNILFRSDRPVNTLHLMELNQLYREESQVKNDFQDLMLPKIADPDTPQPKQDLPGNSTQRSIQQGPILTSSDYRLLTNAYHQRFGHDADRLAKGNNLTERTTTQSNEDFPLHVRETLEDFFQEYGVPNSAERYMLTEALGISAQEVDDFCKSLARDMSTHSQKADQIPQSRSKQELPIPCSERRRCCR